MLPHRQATALPALAAFHLGLAILGSGLAADSRRLARADQVRVRIGGRDCTGVLTKFLNF